MKKFDYKTFYSEKFSNSEEEEKFLKEKGQEGWQLIQIMVYKNNPWYGRVNFAVGDYYFIREIQESEHDLPDLPFAD